MWDFFGLSYIYYAHVRAKNRQIVVFCPVNLTLTVENLTLIGLVLLIFTDFVSRRLTAAPESIASAMQKTVKISQTCPISVSKQDTRDGNTALDLIHSLDQS